MAELTLTLSRHSKDVNCCVFSPNSSILVSGSSDKTVRLWDIPEGTELNDSPLQGHSYHVCSCAFSPFGTLLATASTDCSVWLWDTRTYEKITALEGHRGAVRSCVFSPDSLLLMSGSADETVCLWSTKTKKLVRRIEGFESSVMTCSFTPDNLYILAGVSNGEVSLWEVQSGVCKAFDKEANDMGVNTCCFSPTFGSAGPCNTDTSGSSPHFLLVTGGGDNLVKLWNIFTASAYSDKCHIGHRATLVAHEAPVWECTFSNNGKLLASCSGDKTVIIWNPLEGTPLHRVFAHSRYVTCCAFSPDGQYLASGSNDRTVKVWKLNLSETSAGLIESGNMVKNLTKNDTYCTTTSEPKAAVKKLVAWTVDDVCIWLTNLNLELYCERFRENAIDGTELFNITAELLVNDLCIGPVGHRNKILRSVKDLKKNELDDNIPDEFLCPITREVMIDPVIAADGHSYERKAIESWMLSGKLTSPMTNKPIKHSNLISNTTLKSVISRYFSAENVI
ncbi:WD repeat, SAM and U-box domain-containing protein 1-like [Xenia sp. Carnegie-2017]|uniref:WD repeat, SAM and U-box domain-containing protein 1-like n=1 Tax=Xenia sp. Carnegie-2017 TaxID=2897299 RepID=UPI001F045DE2|nr:WD repeat, SAM and U-box domain-containing protein 1-like [Xenia sp. Carnegie-2017]